MEPAERITHAELERRAGTVIGPKIVLYVLKGDGGLWARVGDAEWELLER